MTEKSKQLRSLEIKEKLSKFTDKGTVGLGYVQSTMFVGVFSFFFTRREELFLLQEHDLFGKPLQVYVFPLVALVDFLEAIFAGVNFATAHNKNLEKSLYLANKIIKASLVITAVSMGVYATINGVATLSAVVPYVFIAVMLVNTAFSLSAAIYHAVRMFKAPKASVLREAHKQALAKNIVGTVAGLTLTVVVGALLAVGVSSAIGLPILASAGIIAIVGAVIFNALIKRYSEKKRLRQGAESEQLKIFKVAQKGNVSESDSDNDEQPLLPDDLIKNALKEDVSVKDIVNASHGAGSKNDRFYVRIHLKSLLATAEHKGEETLKRVFISIVDEKISKLRSQIIESRDKRLPGGRPVLFNLFVPDETAKRNAKISGLTKLKQLIEEKKQGKLLFEQIDAVAAQHPGIFQSFWKEKSDVELIFDTAKEFFANKKEPLCMVSV